MIFQFYCGWSGQSAYEEIVYTGFNFFLFAPILFVGVFDQDISAETAHEFPPSYAVGRLNSDLNPRTIGKYILMAFLLGSTVSLLPMLGWYSRFNVPFTTWSSDGTSEGLMGLGTTTYMCLIWAMTIKVLFMQRTWTWFMPSLSVGAASIAFFYLAILFYNSQFVFEEFWTMSYYGVFEYMLGNTISWLIVILVSGVVIMVEISLQACNRSTPTDTELLIASEHGLGPTNTDGSLKVLMLRPEARATVESMDEDGDDDDDDDDDDDHSSESKTVRSSEMSVTSDDSDKSNTLSREDSMHSGTSRTSARRRWGNVRINISAKNLRGLENTMDQSQIAQMGLKSLKYVLYFCCCWILDVFSFNDYLLLTPSNLSHCFLHSSS